MAIPEVELKQEVVQFRGLTANEVEASRQKYGNNILTPPAREPWWKLYLEKFQDPVIRILMIAAGITILVGLVDGHYAEGVGIVIAILLATSLAFFNEYRATREFDVLNQVNDEAPTNVIREGAYVIVPRKDLVVGDIVLIEGGAEVPADGLVREALALQINEAVLTGESLPVHKVVSTSETAADARYTEDKVLRSTLAVDGRGIFETTAVGDATVIGKIAREATSETDEVTPLNAQLERLSKLIGVIGFGVAALTYIGLVLRGVSLGELVLSSANWLFVGILTASALTILIRIWLPIVYDAFELIGRPKQPFKWLEEGGLSGWLKPLGIGLAIFIVGVLASIALGWLPSTPSAWLPAEVGTALLRYFMVAVTIIVVAVPEGLPMSVTLSLAYSMRRMTATNNLVRRMHATETVGAATVICSDKTGTLTLNQMHVRETRFPALGERPLTSELETQAERLIVEAFAADTTANLSRVAGEHIRPIGDSTEGALLLWLDERGIDYMQYRLLFKTRVQLTFSAERKYMGTLGISSVLRDLLLHVKGAPEIVMDQCSMVLTEDGLQPLEDFRAEIEEQLLVYQKRGMRTLAFAYKSIASDDDLNVEHLVTDMIWLGYVAIADPIRPEVPAAVQACRDAGIMVKIVTGDNAETAKEIARQISLWDPEDDEREGVHLSGREFEAMSDEQAREAVLKLKVLSRARPLDKMRLVTSLQATGQVVAVTGDGTNDAPALNYANVGLAMGSGTDIAKEASDIVLLDDSFRSIVNAVMWGRSLYQNIQRFILFQLTINVAALGIALLGPFIGVQFPLTVIQMLWVNLIMDTFASLALATEPAHWEVMRRKPRKSSDFIITPGMARRILGLGVTFIAVLVLILFSIQSDGVESAYELSAFYAIFIMLQFWNLFNARVLGRNVSAFSGIRENRAFLWIAGAILLGTILIVQFGGEIFRTVPLSLADWLTIILATSPVLLIGELVRFLRGREQPAVSNSGVGV
jgi:Ca2+-transporting ATPase